MNKFNVGDKVRVREPEKAYGSDYPKGQSPVVVIQPDMVGVVAVIDVPSVYGIRSQTYICVDYVLPGVYHFFNLIHGHNVWRIGTPAFNLKLAKQPTESPQ